MNDALISQIEELGLSNKEARVYIANLTLGPAGVQQIADTSGIKRVTTYVILEALVNLGLVSQTNKAKKTFFNAEAPENLRRLIEKREQSLEDQKQQLDELLPQLKELKSVSRVAPVIKFYEGAEGIHTVIWTIFEESKKTGLKEIYAVTNRDQLYNVFPDIGAMRTNPARLASGFHSKVLFTTSDEALKNVSDVGKNRESRYIPPDTFPINGDMTIIGDKVAIVSFDKSIPVAVVIDSSELVRTFTTLFMLAWQTAGNYNSLETSH
jgi:sugar-specific transcriptional regulator TrmB